MTRHEAKELSLEVWRYLAEHPEINKKHDLPPHLFEKISDLFNQCPLCDYFYTHRLIIFYGLDCSKCPLDDCTKDGSTWGKWEGSTDKEERQFYAQKIVDAIEA
jgi:hypothetical protein